MSERKSKTPLGRVPKPREVIVRFRVTEEEYATIQEAAEFDGSRFEAELLERGLPKSAVETLKRPSEWMRYIVMKAAAPKAEEARVQRRKQQEVEQARAEAESERLRQEAMKRAERLMGGRSLSEIAAGLSRDIFPSDIGAGLTDQMTVREATKKGLVKP